MKSAIWRIKYYFRRLFAMDWKSFFESVSLAKKRSGKLWIVVFFDMIISSFRYSAGYNDYIEFEFFLMNHAQRLTYLTAPRSMAIAKKYNEPSSTALLLDKSELYNHYGPFISRQFLDLKTANTDDLEKFIRKHKCVMFKVVDGNSGDGITKFDYDENQEVDFASLYDKLIENKQFLIEEYFVQHSKMAELSPSSVNTIRMVTFIDDHKVPHLITSALKIGVGGYIDNIGQGGLYTILSYEGVVVVPFINKQGDHVVVHPITKMDLIGFKVPNFKHIKDQILKVSMVLPKTRYVGWDISINQNGDLEIIEGNPFTGPFQLPASLAKDKQGILPKLSQYMS